MEQISQPHKFSRKIFLACLGTVFMLIAPLSHAQNWPRHPISLIVGNSAGGGIDVVARAVAKEMTQTLGQSVIVENVVGAAGLISAQKVASAKPDGYTLLMNSSNLSGLPSLRKHMPFDLEHAFAPIALVAIGPMVFTVKAAMPVNSIQDVIKLAQSRPSQLTYGSGGIGGTTHLASELFNEMAHVKIKHIPYKGASDLITAVAGGQIDIGMSTLPAVEPFLQAGKIKALAVTSLKRMKQLPKLPTISEAGVPGYESLVWWGMAAPAGTPQSVINTLNAAVRKAVASKNVQRTFDNLGIEGAVDSPAEFAQWIHKDILKTSELEKKAGVQAQ